MTAQNQTESLQQLNEVVAQLAATVSASERRYASLARAMRWGALVFVVLVAAVAYVATDIVKAYADQIPPWPVIENQIAEDPPKLDDIIVSLGATREIQGALVKVLQSAAAISTTEITDYLDCVQRRANDPQKEVELCYSEAAVEDLGQYFLDANGELPQPPMPPADLSNEEAKKEYERQKRAYGKRLMEGTLMAGGQVVVDAAALIHRLRRDSDFFRSIINKIGGTNELLKGIKNELNRMNGMLVAIPPMSHEVHLMNRHMSVMTQSMGSTMGRMGSMMPW